MDARELERDPVGHRCVHHLPLARRPRMEDTSADAEREHHPAAPHVADQVERHDRVPVSGPDRTERARERDVVDVVPRLTGQRAVLSPTGHPSVHELRVPREAGPRTEAEPLRDAGPEALDERLRQIDQPKREVPAFRGLEIDRHRAPAAVQDGRERLRPGKGRTVDAHDLGSEIGEDHPAEAARARFPRAPPRAARRVARGERASRRLRSSAAHPHTRSPSERAGLDSIGPSTRGEEAALLNESTRRCAR